MSRNNSSSQQTSNYQLYLSMCLRTQCSPDAHCAHPLTTNTFVSFYKNTFFFFFKMHKLQ